jgi:hypothetical protein
MGMNESEPGMRGLDRWSGQLPDQVIEGFLRILEEARRTNVTCREVFAQLDEYVEKEVGGKDAAQLMPLLKEHLDLCTNCCDEYESLLRILQGQRHH